MSQSITVEQVLTLSEQLSLVEKVRLIELIVPKITRELTIQKQITRKSLRGIWSTSNLSEAQINENRDEMWVNFPDRDI